MFAKDPIERRSQVSRQKRKGAEAAKSGAGARRLKAVNWVSDYEGIGNTYGYSTLNSRLQAELKKYVEFDPEANRLAAVATPIAMNWEAIKEMERKISLFTMWEHGNPKDDDQKLPTEWLKILNTVDHIVVPCKHNKAIFQHDLPDKRIDVCPLGVDTDVFRYKERHFPDLAKEPFRFLWVGAPNPRKGFSLVLKLTEAFPANARVEFYFKSTVPKKTDKVEAGKMLAERGDYYQQRLKEWDCKISMAELEEHVMNNEDLHGQVFSLNMGADGKPQNKTLTVDFRDLPRSELIDLYHSAHAFIFPSVGEGFGLTLAEAMATGPNRRRVAVGMTERAR